jgi:hypothetical protein
LFSKCEIEFFQVAEKIGYTEKLSDLKIGIFHNLCNDFILKNLSSRKWTLFKKMELEMANNQRIRKIPQLDYQRIDRNS